MDYYTSVLKKYAVFEGRARRKEYWMFVLISFLISLVLAVLESSADIGDMLTNIYSLAILVPTLAVGVRRLHDVGKSGWWLLIGLIPLIGLIILIVLFARDSVPGSNKYGPNPKEGATPNVA